MNASDPPLPTDSPDHDPLRDAILVTGAGRRIGLHIATRLLDEGHAVIAHYRSPTPELTELAGRGAVCIQADLADAGQVRELAASILRTTASLRAIIHNASDFARTSSDMDEALDQMERFMAIHVSAPYALNTLLKARLEATSAKLADIIQITDIFADRPNPVFDVYCASKAASQNLALSFARRLAPRIKSNIIQPGPVLFKEWHGPEARESVLKETPLGVEGGVDPIWIAVRGLLDNPYQTGSVIQVDGGRRLS